MQSCECLHQAAEKLGRPVEAYQHFQRYVTYRDSLTSQDLTRQLTKMEMDFAFKKKLLADSLATAEERIRTAFEFNARITNQKNQRNIILLIGLGFLLMAAGLYSRLKYVRRSRQLIQSERDRSDGLLLNILPAPVAEELKTHGKAAARDYEEVSVLFSDIVGFTKHSERLSAHELLSELNLYFAKFDEIAVAHGLEKIKTVGDAYMAVGGLPETNPASTRNTILAALEMREVVARLAWDRKQQGQAYFEMRFGIHTGPVIAGIVGQIKFQYDIWGDTVNPASRLESHSEAGRVNISAATYRLVNDDAELQFEPRGKINVKGKGELEMYFVAHRPKAERKVANSHAQAPGRP
jgi:class 3 adenylate cyclase